MQEILGGGSLRSCLLELKTMIQTPIKRFESSDSSSNHFVEAAGSSGKRDVIEDGDLPSQFTKVMGKGMCNAFSFSRFHLHLLC